MRVISEEFPTQTTTRVPNLNLTKRMYNENIKFKKNIKNLTKNKSFELSLRDHSSGRFECKY